jgi:hypothetical protein
MEEWFVVYGVMMGASSKQIDSAYSHYKNNKIQCMTASAVLSSIKSAYAKVGIRCA